MKKALVLLLTAALCVSLFSPFALASEISSVPISGKVYEGRDLILDNVVTLPELGLVVVTTEELSSRTSDGSEMARIDPNQQATKTFSHKIYSSDGVLLATCHATVAGTYSQSEDWAQIDSVSAYFAGTFAHEFTDAASKSPDAGSLYLYFSGVSAGSFTYHISKTGVISNV